MQKTSIGKCIAMMCVVAIFLTGFSFAEKASEREIFPGITTTQPVHGGPYELLGKRMVFTNWYYIQPGDLDWRDANGKSVYVKGDSKPFEAHFVGIRSPRGIRLMAQKPVIIGPLSRPDRCIIQDGNLYRGWDGRQYSESNDGMNWQKKADLVYDREIGDGVYHVFKDPAGQPSERFKSVWVNEINAADFNSYRAEYPNDWDARALLLFKENGKAHCLRASVSPDGINWTTYQDPILVEYCDTYNTAYYDQALRKYVLYTRCASLGICSTKVPVDVRNNWTYMYRRAIGRSESSDFKHFPVSQMILEPPPTMLPSEQLYTNCYITIPGAPDHHLMFPTLWNASIDDTTKITMASSHDGIIWHFVPGAENLIETQPFGQWNGGCVWVAPNMIELPDGTWALPYSAHNVPHKYPRKYREGRLGYATWPKGRLVAVEAPDRGEFATVEFILPAGKLKINAVTLRTGSIRIEVKGIGGKTFGDCKPIFGDQFWTPVTWKDGTADLGVEPGKPITLLIKMEQAKLFGLEFVN